MGGSREGGNLHCETESSGRGRKASSGGVTL